MCTSFASQKYCEGIIENLIKVNFFTTSIFYTELFKLTISSINARFYSDLFNV